MNPHFFKPHQIKRIVAAIREAELNTSGEIRVHVSSQPSKDHLETAVAVFEKLNMSQTKDRNGVLFHLSLADKNFTIIGDVGIDQRTKEDFWDEIKTAVIKKFKKGKFTKGLVLGIHRAGDALKIHFPYQEDDINELPNEISWD